MYIKSLGIQNFRNYEFAEILPCCGTNLILGMNAQGKTNLIEAIYFLSCARSFRASRECELVRFGNTDAKIRAKLFSSRDYTIEVGFGTKREIFINDVKKRKTSELLGILNTVLFCPEDLFIVRNGAAARRKFIDSALCQLRPNYAVLLNEYTKLLLHKTRILKDREKYPALLDTLDDFSERMCSVAAQIIPYRAKFLSQLDLYAKKIHLDISSQKEDLSLFYKTVSAVTDGFASREKIYSELSQHYYSHKSAEIASMSCLSGIHKDDFTILINGISAKTFASQGQTRTAALSLKLGVRDLFYSDTGQYPILILDDVLSELDESRRRYILNGISSGQVFITACDANDLLHAGRVFEIKNGSIF